MAFAASSSPFVAAEATAIGVAVTATVAAVAAGAPWVVVILAIVATILWATVAALAAVVAFLGGQLNAAGDRPRDESKRETGVG